MKLIQVTIHIRYTIFIERENHHMESSHKKACKCGNLHMYFFWFKLKKDMRDMLQSHESFIHAWASTKLNGEQPPVTQVHLHRKTWKYGSGNWENGRRDRSWTEQDSFMKKKNSMNIQMTILNGLSHVQPGLESHSLEIGSLVG